MEVSATPIDYLNEAMQMDVFLAPLTDVEAQVEFLNTVIYVKGEHRDAREEAEYEYHHKRGHNVFDIEDIISSDPLTTRPMKPLPKRGKAQQPSATTDDDQATGITDGLERLAILEESTTQASPNADAVSECDAAAPSATQAQVQTSGDALDLSIDTKGEGVLEHVSVEPIGNTEGERPNAEGREEDTSAKAAESPSTNDNTDDSQTGTRHPVGLEEGDATAVSATANAPTASQLPDLVTSSLLAQLSVQAQVIIGRNGGGNNSPNLLQSDIAIIRQLELHLARITASNTSSPPTTEKTQPDMVQQRGRPLEIATSRATPSIATSKAGYPVPPAIWPPICSFGALAIAPPQPTGMTTAAPPIAYPYGPFSPYGIIL